MKNSKSFFTYIKFNIFAFLFFLIAWFILSLFYKEYIIPSPLNIFKNIGTYLNGEFYSNFFITLFRILSGFAISFIFGTLIGIISFILNLKVLINTLFILIQVIPGIILGVILLIIFGIGSAVPIALITFLTMPLIIINTTNALYKHDKKLVQLILTYNGNFFDIVEDVYIPELIPTILSNLTLGFGLSIKIVVLGEFIGSQKGIGYLLNVAKIYYNMDEVFFYLLILTFIMLFFQIIITVCSDLFLKKYYFE